MYIYVENNLLESCFDRILLLPIINYKSMYFVLYCSINFFFSNQDEYRYFRISPGYKARKFLEITTSVRVGHIKVFVGNSSQFQYPTEENCGQNKGGSECVSFLASEKHANSVRNL